MEFYFKDTIAAIATPPGRGAIGIIKISGDQALEILKTLFRPVKSVSEIKPRYLYYGHIVDPKTEKIVDEVLAVYMRKPFSYTKEDVVEIYAHSGYVVLRKILELVFLAGARPAEPGEFTLRAFLNGRIDLSQAEAVEELISAKSETALDFALNNLLGKLSEKVQLLRNQLLEVLAQVESAIDFPEEDLEIMNPPELIKKIEEEILPTINFLISNYQQGKFYREGINLVIAGKPNVGKSSLMNALLREERAIVTPVPGTTRDFLEEPAMINGIPVRLIDTAGLRETKDLVEKIGVEKAKDKLREADLVLFLVDISLELTHEDLKIYEEIKKYPHLVVLNKIDLKPNYLEDWKEFFLKEGKEFLEISALKGTNLEKLSQKIVEKILGEELGGQVPEVIPNLRQKVALEKAKEFLENALEELKGKNPLPELVAVELRGALSSLSEIVGEVTTDEILTLIFSSFCIGK